MNPLSVSATMRGQVCGRARGQEKPPHIRGFYGPGRPASPDVCGPRRRVGSSREYDRDIPVPAPLGRTAWEVEDTVGEIELPGELRDPSCA
jgi:hypothetical protein